MTYCVTSTTGLMDRTPARRNRSRIQTGVVARLLTPWMTQPTNVGQAAGASKWTATESRADAAPTDVAPRPEATPATNDGWVAVSSSAQASMVSGSVASNTSTSLVNS